MKISLLSRIKGIFSQQVEKFDNDNPEIKINAMIENNERIIAKAKDQLANILTEKITLIQKRDKATEDLKICVKNLERAKNEGKDYSVYVKTIKMLEDLLANIENGIEKSSETYKTGIMKLKTIEDKNIAIENTKQILLTRLALSKLNTSTFDLDNQNICSVDEIFADVNRQLNKLDADDQVNKDLGHNVDDIINNMRNETDDVNVDDILKKYKNL